jgi:hypothetical protein
MNAYDYDSQRWIAGAEGTRLLIARAEAELAVLRSPLCGEFLRFVGATCTVEATAGGHGRRSSLRELGYFYS